MDLRKNLHDFLAFQYPTNLHGCLLTRHRVATQRQACVNTTAQYNQLNCLVMIALPNTGGALRPTPQSLADAHYLTAASGPKFTMLWGRLEEILLLNKFFFRLSIRALVAKI